MAQLTVFKKCIRVRYQASRLSKASVINSVLWLINIVYPWAIVYYSDGLWRRVETYWEQPTIRFRYKTITALNLANSSVPGDRIVWSSCTRCNKVLNQGMIRVPLITVSWRWCSAIDHKPLFIQNYEVDEDLDGKFDKLKINIKVPLETGEHVNNVQVFLFFDYYLQVRLELSWEASARQSY